MLDYLICEFVCFLHNLDENYICRLKKTFSLHYYLFEILASHVPKVWIRPCVDTTYLGRK